MGAAKETIYFQQGCMTSSFASEVSQLHRKEHSSTEGLTIERI